jgi:hypothetical protein
MAAVTALVAGLDCGDVRMGSSIAIPEDPAEFFERFFPAQFTKDRHRYGGHNAPGWALFEVIGVGAWGLRREGDTLAVTRGKPQDTLVQISVSQADFRAIFVERTQREVAATGDLSDDSRDVFKPLFIEPHALDIIANAAATLAFHLNHEGTARRVFITPGPLARTEPRTTITMHLHDFLAMLGGRKGFATLLFLGKLKIRGDVLYARRMSALLG